MVRSGPLGGEIDMFSPSSPIRPKGKARRASKTLLCWQAGSEAFLTAALRRKPTSINLTQRVADMAMLLCGTSLACGHLQARPRQSPTGSSSSAFSQGCTLRHQPSAARIQRPCPALSALGNDAEENTSDRKQRRAPADSQGACWFSAPADCDRSKFAFLHAQCRPVR